MHQKDANGGDSVIPAPTAILRSAVSARELEARSR